MSAYTSFIAGVVFPLQERLKKHDTVRVRRELEATQWWSAEVAPLLAGLLRVLERVHHERRLAIDATAVAADCGFAGEAQDLQEILGNVLDNACKWARGMVHVEAALHGAGARPRLRIVVDDDGPGIDLERRRAALARGARLDESVPGSGLGLAIALELVDLYHGELTLGDSPLGGLRVEVGLPGTLL